MSSAESGERFPEIALAVDPKWPTLQTPAELRALRSLVRIDLTEAGFVRPPIDGPFDLEAVVSDDRGELDRDLGALAARLDEVGLRPDHVATLPRAYLKSHQPAGPWPAGATPSDAARAARAAFPGAAIGGGALTNFTEFNRRPPDPHEVDYVTHGSTATVHTADDLSVFQTIEALPDIFRSARRLAPDKPYRLGLVSIAMRTNPYGAGLAANPEGVRKTMSGDDPRARGLFGAAWMVAVAAASEGAGVALLTLASRGGPFAAHDGSTLFPSFHVLAAFAHMQRRPRLRVAAKDPVLYGVAAAAEQGGALAVVANGSADAKTLACGLEGDVAVLDAGAAAAARRDPAWMRSARRPLAGRLDLGPYAVAFIAARAPAGVFA